jgi:Ser/Thr protein kinase RdoA (MazF antagonist)
MGDAVMAAMTVARRLGLEADQPSVLRDLSTTLVHLAPSPVLARAWPTGRRDPAVVEAELAITSYVAASGAPAAGPYADGGPHEADGFTVTLWDYLDHDPDRPLDGEAAGGGLRMIHELLASPDAPTPTGLPDFARQEEATAIIAALDLDARDRADLEELVARARRARDLLGDLPVQPLHGDAWLGNVLRTPEGPVWSDFELTCRGPVEVDLAANLSVSRHRGKRAGDDELLEGYGEVDRDLVARVLPVALVPFIAWTYRLSATRPEFLTPARERLAMALADLRANQD